MSVLRVLVSWVVFCAALCVGAAAQAVPLVLEARLGQNGNTLRFVLETDEKVTPTYFTLDKPDRLVLDFAPMDFKINLNKLDVPSGNKILKNIRSARFNPTKHRIVLDLAQPVKVTLFNIPPREGAAHRLVVDMTPLGGKGGLSKVTQKAAPATHEDYVPDSIFDMQEPRKTVIIIDPGHGGVDPGAIGKYKTREKDVVLQVAKKLKVVLDNTPGFEAHLTRNSDVFVRLSDRVKKAQKHSGDIFISLHADAHNDRRISGGSVYVLSEKSSDKEAERLARIANDGDLFAGLDLSHEPKEVQNILIDLTQRETLNSSARLARQMVLALEKSKVSLRTRRTKFAGFRVLKAPEIPSVLVEMAYISNPVDERNLGRRDYQQTLAESIAEGIKRFVSNHQNN